MASTTLLRPYYCTAGTCTLATPLVQVEGRAGTYSRAKMPLAKHVLIFISPAQAARVASDSNASTFEGKGGHENTYMKR